MAPRKKRLKVESRNRLNIAVGSAGKHSGHNGEATILPRPFARFVVPKTDDVEQLKERSIWKSKNLSKDMAYRFTARIK
mgnify:CR=1 FL=1